MPRLLLMAALAVCAGASDFRSVFSNAERSWAGPDYWANPLQDWRVRDGRLECIAAGGDRNVFLLTRETNGAFAMSVRTGRLDEAAAPMRQGFVGFRFGIRGAFLDYRDSAVRGVGVNAGIASDGRLFIGTLTFGAPRAATRFDDLVLRLTARPGRVVLEALDPAGRRLAEVVRTDVGADLLEGGVALVCHSGAVEPTLPLPVAAIDGSGGGRTGTERGGTHRFWFRDWIVSGEQVAERGDRGYGPILFTMYTVSRRTLKLTAQMAPVSGNVRLEVREPAGSWREAGRVSVDSLSRTATFRIRDWDDTHDRPYRVVYVDAGNEYMWSGTIRQDPRGKPKIVVAAFTGNNDLGFPHSDVVSHVSYFRPDLLVFTGDQIYERVGDYGIQRSPVETAALDYLRKWYIFGWEYRDLLKDIPSVCLPDDHDVYHGNLWGAGGRPSPGEGYEAQDRGGYLMPAAWVNAVQRTQTSHLPDPFDGGSVEQGIGVYYTPLLWGGVSFAIIEDRKWKSPPRIFLPQADIVNGWPQNPRYNAARDGDSPRAQLLGERQHEFLDKWAADWSGGAWMKAVLSQTIFAAVTTLPKGSLGDKIVPKLPIPQPGEYVEGDAPVMDHDTNAWPQTARNAALRAMRRAFALHIAGDQHLGSTIQYGIDEWNDAGWAICVPSVANYFPRRWSPPQPGRNRRPGAPRYTGEFLDGFGNRMTVHAVSNPSATAIEPAVINQRAPGYGIVTFDRETRKIALANWPRWVDPAQSGAEPYPGWPITIDQLDNGFPKNGPALPPIVEKKVMDPVVQVMDEVTKEILYTVRIKGATFTPRVWKPGTYTVTVTDPDEGYRRVYRKRVAGGS